jgi:hypothetical protein
MDYYNYPLIIDEGQLIADEPPEKDNIVFFKIKKDDAKWQFDWWKEVEKKNPYSVVSAVLPIPPDCFLDEEELDIFIKEMDTHISPHNYEIKTGKKMPGETVVFYKSKKMYETWHVGSWKDVNLKKKESKYTFDIVIAYPPVPPES